MACGTLRTLTWCVSARVPVNVTSQSTHRGPSLIGAHRNVKRDREETPGSEAALPSVLSRVLQDDERNDNGGDEGKRYDVPSASPCETYVNEKVREEMQAKTRWTHI